MDSDSLPIAWLASARAIHFAACLLLFCICTFECFIVGPVTRQERDFATRYWRPLARRLTLFALPIAIFSAAAWFALVTIDMSSLPPSQALQMNVLGRVWNHTHFGSLWQFRTMLLVFISIPTVVLFRWKSDSPGRFTGFALQMLFAGTLCGSLAWTGHGQMGNDPHWHLLTDVSHLLICGVWPFGLIPLALLLMKVGRSADFRDQFTLSLIIRRFSLVSLISVALLAITGFANGFILVGSFFNLIGTTYGKLLLTKVAVFVLMIAFGAVNLLYLRPRISVDLSGESASASRLALARLRINVICELILAFIVIGIVGFLGLLMPPNCGM